jgi:hypothetical protein
MTETWKDIAGFEGRYQVSDLGRVRSLPRKQRYTHWRTGEELFRSTAGRILATQTVNSGYGIVHLHADNQRVARLVHRLVADAFLPPPAKPLVNHLNGNKADNRAVNLEWVTDTENKLHAVEHGLNVQAIVVVDPATGLVYPSITQAARHTKRSHRTVRATFLAREAS